MPFSALQCCCASHCEYIFLKMSGMPYFLLLHRCIHALCSLPCTLVAAANADQYLAPPTASQLRHILHENARRGFPGMLGSLDCMHWTWQNCPYAWKGYYTGKEKVPTVVLEAVADKRRRIWHCFFGAPGALNDINILDRSPLFDQILRGEAPKVEFTINNNQYEMGYFLVDGIYPPWAAFVTTINDAHAVSEMAATFAKLQEGVRKDVECCFADLQNKFSIVANPCKLWDVHAMVLVMHTVIILHNMIKEDKYPYDSDVDSDDTDDERPHGEDAGVLRGLPAGCAVAVRAPQPMIGFDRQLANNIESKQQHDQLQNDLVQHVWQHVGRRRRHN